MKTCKKEGCSYSVFSHDYCKFHQYLREDIKNKKKSIKTAKTGEKDVFMSIYEENKKQWVSWISSKPLVHEDNIMFYNQFSHILAKGMYPKVRLEKDNIWPITAEEHRLIDFGTEDERQMYELENGCSFKSYFELKDKLKQIL